MKTFNNGPYRVVEDDSGHWYAIPAGDVLEFGNWVASWDDFESFDSAVRYAGKDFEQFRIGGHPSALLIEEYKCE